MKPETLEALERVLASDRELFPKDLSNPDKIAQLVLRTARRTKNRKNLAISIAVAMIRVFEEKP